jgi:hypothetical protein
MAMRYYAPFPGRDGEPYKPMPRHVLRIGDAERDAAAADLGEHYVAGRLTLNELNERLGEVFAAKTHGQLWKVMSDLPGSAHLPRPSWHVPDIPQPAGSPRPPAMLGPPEIAGRRHDTPSDRAGRFAALSLLILAMLIWLFTALLFTRHGYYYHPGPFGPGGYHPGPFGPGGR